MPSLSLKDHKKIDNAIFFSFFNFFKQLLVHWDSQLGFNVTSGFYVTVSAV